MAAPDLILSKHDSLFCFKILTLKSSKYSLNGLLLLAPLIVEIDSDKASAQQLEIDQIKAMVDKHAKSIQAPH